MTTTKFTGLSGLQTAALAQAVEEHVLPATVQVNKTTAVFPWDAATTHSSLLEVKAIMAAKHGSRQHPVASLHAGLRKAAKAAMDA